MSPPADPPPLPWGAQPAPYDDVPAAPERGPEPEPDPDLVELDDPDHPDDPAVPDDPVEGATGPTGPARSARRGRLRTAGVLAVGLTVGWGAATLLGGDEPGPVPPYGSSGSAALMSIDPSFSSGLADVCERRAVLERAQPFPDDPADLRVAITQEQLPYPTAEAYARVPIDRPWAHRGESYDDLNGVVCVSIVPDSLTLRTGCFNQTDADVVRWDVYGARWVVTVLDPTTGEVVAEGEPFDSTEVVGTPTCATPPPAARADRTVGVVDLDGTQVVRAQVETLVGRLSSR